MSTTYDYSKDPAHLGRLEREIVAAGLPQPEGSNWNENETPNDLHITFASALTGPQETTLDGVVAAHDGTPGTYEAPRGFSGVAGCRLAWDTVSTVKIGRASKISRAGDAEGRDEIAFTGRKTVDITASGAGGLDAGSVAANTWYAVFVIADRTRANTPAGLFSLSEDSPTIPAGYDLYRRIGWVKTDGSSEIRRFFAQGEDTQRRYVYDAEIGVMEALSAGGETTWTEIDLGNWVPPSSEVVQFTAELSDSGSAINQWAQLRPNGSTVTTSVFRIRTGPLDAAREIWSMPCPGQKVDYKTKTATNELTLWVAGFVDDL